MWQVGPCHHGMARPQVAVGGAVSDMVATDILNKQSWTAVNGWGVGRGANNSSL